MTGVGSSIRYAGETEDWAEDIQAGSCVYSTLLAWEKTSGDDMTAATDDLEKIAHGS